MDRLDKLQNVATKKKGKKEKKHRRLRETIGYLISLIWEVFQKVLFLLFLVSPIIARVTLGGVAALLISIVVLYYIFFIIFEAIKGKSDPNFKDLFKFDTFFFCVICLVITAIIYLYVSILY